MPTDHLDSIAPDPGEAPSPAAASRPGRPWRRWALWAIAALLLLGGAGILMTLLLAQPASDLIHIERQVRRLKFAGVIVQLLFVAAVGLWWKELVAYGHRRGFVKAFELQAVQALRWKVVAFLVAFLALVVIGPGEFHRLWMQGL